MNTAGNPALECKCVYTITTYDVYMYHRNGDVTVRNPREKKGELPCATALKLFYKAAFTPHVAQEIDFTAIKYNEDGQESAKIVYQGAGPIIAYKKLEEFIKGRVPNKGVSQPAPVV